MDGIGGINQPDLNLVDPKQPKMTIKILPFNADRVRAAHDLLAMMTKKLQIDICILAEPNKKIAKAAGWETDSRGDATLIIHNKSITVKKIIKGNGFIAVNTPELTIFSCYVSPNCSFEEYQKDLEELQYCVASQSGDILVALQCCL